MKREIAFLVANPVILQEIVRRPLVVTKRDVFLVESQAILPRIVLESLAALVVDLEEIEVGIVLALPVHIVTSLVMVLGIATMAAVMSPLVIMVVAMILATLLLLTILLVIAFVIVQTNQGEMIILTTRVEDLPRTATLHLVLVTMVRPLLMTTDEGRLPILMGMLEVVEATLLGLSVITVMVVMVVMVVMLGILSVAMVAIHRPDPVLVRDLDPLAIRPTVLELVRLGTDRLLVVAVLLVVVVLLATKEDAVLCLLPLEAHPAPEVPQEVGTGAPNEAILHRCSARLRLSQCPEDSKHLALSPA
jgi:hypothetical protein